MMFQMTDMCCTCLFHGFDTIMLFLCRGEKDGENLRIIGKNKSINGLAIGAISPDCVIRFGQFSQIISHYLLISPKYPINWFSVM